MQEEHNEGPDDTGKKGCRSLITRAGLFALVCAGVGLVADTFAAVDWLKKFFSPTLRVVANEGPIEIKWFTEDAFELGRSPSLMFFSDYVDSNYVGKFNGGCLTSVMLINNTGQQVALSEMHFEASNISIDYTPVLNFSMPFLSRQESDLGNADYIEVTNHGWGNSKPLSYYVCCDDPDFERCFGTARLKRRVDSVPGGGFIRSPFITSADIIEPTASSKRFDPRIEIDDSEGVKVWESAYANIVLIVDGKTAYFESPALGGDFAAFGILLPTEKESFSFNSNINLTIPAGEEYIPLCFFPDKSCTINYRIGFTEAGGGPVMWSETCTGSSTIDSMGNGDFLNAEDYTLDDLAERLEEGNGQVAVSFPFTGLDSYQ